MGDCGSLFIGALLGGASLVPLFHTRDRVRQPGGARGADPRRAAVRHRVRAGAAAARRPQGHARAAPITSRTASSRSDSPSAAPFASSTSSASSAGSTAWVLVTGSGVEPMLPLVALFGVLVDPDRHLSGARAGLQRRGFRRAAEVVVRAVPQGPGVQVARRRGAARPGADHRLLLRRVPAALRRRGPRQLPAVLHGLAAGRARLQAGGALRLGPLSALVGHLRPSRPRGGRARRRARLAAVGLPRRTTSTASRASRARCSCSTRCC